MIDYFHGASGAVGAGYCLRGFEAYLFVGQVWGRLGANGAAAPTAPN